MAWNNLRNLGMCKKLFRKRKMHWGKV